MKAIQLAVVCGTLVAAAMVGAAIAATWQPTHTNMLLLVFGIAATVMAVVFAAVFSFIVGSRVTRGGRSVASVQQPAQVIGGMGRPLPPPPALLGGPGATNAGTYNSLGRYDLAVMSEPWAEVD